MKPSDLNRAAMLTSPDDSPDSQRLIGLIFNHENRPVPECLIYVTWQNYTQLSFGHLA